MRPAPVFHVRSAKFPRLFHDGQDFVIHRACSVRNFSEFVLCGSREIRQAGYCVTSPVLRCPHLQCLSFEVAFAHAINRKRQLLFQPIKPVVNILRFCHCIGENSSSWHWSNFSTRGHQSHCGRLNASPKADEVNWFGFVWHWQINLSASSGWGFHQNRISRSLAS